MLMPGNKKIKDIEKTAAHELGHHYLRLDEPLCYAFGEFYAYTHGTTTLKDMEFELAKNQTQQYGYLQGLWIAYDSIREAVRKGAKPEEIFWQRARQLSKRKEHQWL